MFRYNPKTNYQPNGGHYLQILSGNIYCLVPVSINLFTKTFQAYQISVKFCDHKTRNSG